MILKLNFTIVFKKMQVLNTNTDIYLKEIYEKLNKIIYNVFRSC